MNGLTSKLILHLNTTVPEKTSEWVKLFKLFYGDLLDGEEWKKSVQSLGFSSNNENQILLCMYTAYSMTIKGLQNHILSDHVPHGSRTDAVSIFTDEMLQEFNIKPNSDIELFDWAINSNDNEIIEALIQHAAIIQKYNTTILLNSVDSNRPFTKLIFQSFFPKTVRHHLGEYYTPKWLVQMTINQSLVVDKSFGKRNFIDPSCGSGAFLVELIHRLSKTGKYSILDICQMVCGIDINPVAVTASTTNYVLSLLSSFSFDEFNSIEKKVTIPVYFGDSMLSPSSIKDGHYSIPTSDGEIVYSKNITLADFSVNMEFDASNKSGQSYAKAQHKLSLLGKFTDMVGNPPWISWEHVSEEYKAKMKSTFLEKYSLYEKQGNDSRLGIGHDDICVAFMMICSDRFLKKNGRISLLLKQSIYQGEAHSLFRTLEIKKGDTSRLLKLNSIIDLSSGNPFESSGAATSIAVITADKKTKFPVKYIKYQMNSIQSNHVDIELEEFERTCKYDECLIQPESQEIQSLPWLVSKKGEVVQKSGTNSYPIRHGYVNDLASVFFVNICAEQGGNLIVTPSNSGKKKVEQIQYEIEKDKIFPGLKARHIKKWKITGYNAIIVPQKKYTEDNESELIENNPLLYHYLDAHRELLLGRKSVHIRKEPFYSTFGLGEYTFSEFKVFFNAMGSTKQSFCVGSTHEDEFLGDKLLIPHNNINCISTDSLEEAHFVCGILNSRWVADFVASRIGKSKYPWSTKMMSRIPVPLFDNSDAIHEKISKASLAIHELAKNDQEYFDNETELNLLVSKILD